jgi:hypothetical protein
LAAAPLLLTLLFGWLVMEGNLNLGGGEKDVFLLFPLLLWSLVYLCCFLLLWWRRSALGRTVALSAAIATGLVIAAALILFGASWLRFRT